DYYCGSWDVRLSVGLF
nr:immunoglobulin light chain junction region [Macaca mulatta]